MKGATLPAFWQVTKRVEAAVHALWLRVQRRCSLSDVTKYVVSTVRDLVDEPVMERHLLAIILAIDPEDIP